MKNENALIFSILKGSFLTLITGLVSVLLFAILVKFTALSDTAIKTVDQFIKIMAIFIGCFFSITGKAGWIKGGIIGVLGLFLVYVVFSLLSGTALFTLSISSVSTSTAPCNSRTSPCTWSSASTRTRGEPSPSR